MGLGNQRLAITNGVFYASGRDDPTANTIEVLGREAMASMPVSQAAALQDDLRRARIEPWAWVINKSVAVTGTTDPFYRPAWLASAARPNVSPTAWPAEPLCCPGCLSRPWVCRRWRVFARRSKGERLDNSRKVNGLSKSLT